MKIFGLVSLIAAACIAIGVGMGVGLSSSNSNSSSDTPADGAALSAQTKSPTDPPVLAPTVSQTSRPTLTTQSASPSSFEVPSLAPCKCAVFHFTAEKAIVSPLVAVSRNVLFDRPHQ